MSITAIVTTYNEEARVEAVLKCLNWCDEILVIDKNSSDRTREIAAGYTSNVLCCNNREFDPVVVFRLWEPVVKTDWVLTLSAGDVLGPDFARKILELVNSPEFGFDVIHVPFHRYVLGLETPRSPWYDKVNPGLLFRKRVVRLNEHSVHGSIWFDTGKHYVMDVDDSGGIYHLTHPSVDKMMDRHMIYWRGEANVFPSDKSLRGPLIDIAKAVYRLLFKRRTWLMGWDGVGLGMAYLSYWILRFVYIWEKRRSKAPETYARIRADIEKAWVSEAAVKKDK